jgi:hypothetical protein
MSMNLHESMDKVVIEPATCETAWNIQGALRRPVRHVLTQVAKCIAVDGGLLKNILIIWGKLYQLCHLNNKYWY